MLYESSSEVGSLGTAPLTSEQTDRVAAQLMRSNITRSIGTVAMVTGRGTNLELWFGSKVKLLT